MTPKTKEEYEARYRSNYAVTCYGVETATVFPCPFCAAPEWKVAKIVEFHAAMSDDTVCKECGRGCRTIFDSGPSFTTMKFVQTCGPDPDPWIPPMERVA